ncbi:MAG: sporulation integral membrane protein YtvI [Clostridia bacterium]|nr:sporulation integral membrane protein YtvI [Clostridia bacterium]
MTRIEKKKNFIINVVYATVILALFYLFFKYVFGAVLPIIVAVIVAYALQRPVNFICKKTPLKKGLVSAVTVLMSFLGMFSVVVLLFVWLFSEFKGFVQYLIIRFEDLPTFVAEIESYIVTLVSILPEKVSAPAISFIHEKLNTLISGTPSLSVPDFDFSLFSAPLSGMWQTAKQIPTTLVSVVVSIVASCFITADFDTFKRLVLGLFREETRDKIIRSKRLLVPSLGKYAKAYGLIISITFTELCIGLFTLQLLGIYNNGYIFIIAAITAIVDIVPVLGTGTIVIPWAVYNLFTGNYSLAIGLFVIYICITVIRQVIEPKMVASQLGIPAFLTITSMFIGSQIFGVIGIFILPLTIVMLKLLNDEGIINILHYPKEEITEGDEKK